MNAPAQIDKDDLRRIVMNVFPAIGVTELEARTALLYVQGRAMAARDQASVDAFAVFDHVERLARTYALQRIPLASLEALRAALRDLVASASSLGRFAESLDGPPEVEDEGD